jgi:hypothetical protein
MQMISNVVSKREPAKFPVSKFKVVVVAPDTPTTE